jgi:hypothetical protein
MTKDTSNDELEKLLDQLDIHDSEVISYRQEAKQAINDYCNRREVEAVKANNELHKLHEANFEQVLAEEVVKGRIDEAEKYKEHIKSSLMLSIFMIKDIELKWIEARIKQLKSNPNAEGEDNHNEP